MPSLTSSLNKRSRRMVFALMMMAIFLAACGGGGGGGGDGDKSSPPEDTVTITGTIDDGSGGTPIRNARCSFIGIDGTEHDTDQSDANGTYTLYVPPGIRGYVLAHPQSTPSLILSTTSSTIGLGAGSIKAGEDITPTTTVIVDIINNEDPRDPEVRKAELLSTIENQQDPNLTLVVTIATRLYARMLSEGINSQFGGTRDGADDGGGTSDSDVDGGTSGEAGDGADFSPLIEATCEFVYGSTLLGSEACYSAALGDFFGDGSLNRPDLNALAAEVTAGYDPQTLQQAFQSVFPQGIGTPIATQTDANGRYYLPTPPGVSGFVRCTPKDLEKLVLGTYVAPRESGITLENQDVTPATTVFSAIIAPQLQAQDVAAAKENFIDDIAGLDVQVQFDTSGEVETLSLRPGTEPANENVGLVAFSATALFNAFNKNGLDFDFLTAIDDLVDNAVQNPLNPVDATFLQDQGLTATQAQSVAAVANTSIENTSQQLDTDLNQAQSTGQIYVVVQDEAGQPVQGAFVDIEEQITCTGCESTTGSDGSLVLALSGLPDTATDLVVVVSSVPGYLESRKRVSIAALATVDVVIRLTGASNDTVIGASGNPVNMDGTWDGICDPDIYDGESNLSVITISGGSFSVIERHWADTTNCNGPHDTTTEFGGTYVLGDETTVTFSNTSARATKIDVTVTHATGTIHTQSYVDEVNQRRECGYDDWVMDVGKDIFGTTCGPDPSSKDVIYIDDTGNRDLFYTGDDDRVLDSLGYPMIIDPDSEVVRR